MFRDQTELRLISRNVIITRPSIGIIKRCRFFFYLSYAKVGYCGILTLFIYLLIHSFAGPHQPFCFFFFSQSLSVVLRASSSLISAELRFVFWGVDWCARARASVATLQERCVIMCAREGSESCLVLSVFSHGR